MSGPRLVRKDQLGLRLHSASNILRKALSDYGVNLLMAVELRNWVRNDFGAAISVFEIIRGKLIAEVGGLLVIRAQEKIQDFHYTVNSLGEEFSANCLYLVCQAASLGRLFATLFF